LKGIGGEVIDDGSGPKFVKKHSHHGRVREEKRTPGIINESQQK
jgi:hypothetical protein